MSNLRRWLALTSFITPLPSRRWSVTSLSILWWPCTATNRYPVTSWYFYLPFRLVVLLLSVFASHSTGVTGFFLNSWYSPAAFGYSTHHQSVSGALYFYDVQAACWGWFWTRVAEFMRKSKPSYSSLCRLLDISWTVSYYCFSIGFIFNNYLDLSPTRGQGIEHLLLKYYTPVWFPVRSNQVLTKLVSKLPRFTLRTLRNLHCVRRRSGCLTWRPNGSVVVSWPRKFGNKNAI